MDVKQKLTRLRPLKKGGSPGLAARIERLGKARRQQGSSGESADAALAGSLGGEIIAPGVLLIEKCLPLSGFHGSQPLSTLNQGADDLPGARGVAMGDMWFVDTETTGLSGGSGTLVFMLGMACLGREGLTLRQYLLTRFAGEAAMLQSAADWIRPDATLVSYNGKSFDLPLLATRCRLAGVDDSFSGRRHLDLLHPVRRAFSRQWGDCRLATAEERLLRFHRWNDLPGAQAPAAWLDWIRHSDAGRLSAVCRHNQWDLISLALLLPVMSLVYRNPLRFRADTLSIARLYLAQGNNEFALRLLQSGREQLDDSGLLELAGIYKREGRWRETLEIWRPLAAKGDAEAGELLAKYYEHVARDYGRALGYARQLPDNHGRQHRCRRLQLKRSNFRDSIF